MSKKATKRELKVKFRAKERDILLKRSNKKSYIRPDAYKLPESEGEE